jgi:hypothetical protein
LYPEAKTTALQRSWGESGWVESRLAGERSDGGSRYANAFPAQRAAKIVQHIRRRESTLMSHYVFLAKYGIGSIELPRAVIARDVPADLEYAGKRGGEALRGSHNEAGIQRFRGASILQQRNTCRVVCRVCPCQGRPGQ